MERREFIKKSAAAALAAGAAVSFGGFSKIFASEDIRKYPYDLVAVKGGNPDAMFDKAIASMGGMKNFVKKGQTVCVKPNIGWDSTPELAANTNPLLVKQIIKHCYEAGAKEVYVFDHTCDNWNRCYKNSGIESAVNDAGGKIVSGASEGYYQNISVKSGKILRDAKVHEILLSADVLINVPVLKHHGGGRITVGMKNMMGVVWDRGYWHRNDLHQCIADFSTYCKPALVVVDAYNVMLQNGPRGGSQADLENMKSLLLSTDIVAADSAAAKLFGMDPQDIPYIKYADELKIGSMDLSRLKINRIKM